MWMAVGLVCLLAPVSGPTVSSYDPVGLYAGHWGVDLGAPAGTAVRAPLSGTVTFAGSVVGMRSVTIQNGDLKVSMSYLSEVRVGRGTQVERGSVVGRSGLAHGSQALHVSVRLGDRYVDPAPFLQCRFRPISEALRLVPYPGGSANRNPGRNLRPSPSGASPHRRGGLPAVGSGSGRVHAGRSAVAESAASGVGSQAPLGDDTARPRRRGVLRSRRAGSPPGRVDLHGRHPRHLR